MLSDSSRTELTLCFTSMVDMDMNTHRRSVYCCKWAQLRKQICIFFICYITHLFCFVSPWSIILDLASGSQAVMVRTSVAMAKQHDQRDLEGKEVYVSLPLLGHTPSHRETRGRNSRQDPEVRAWSRDHGGLLFTPHSLFSLFSYAIKNQLPKRGTAHSGLDPPISIINQDSVPLTGLQDNLKEEFFSFRTPSSRCV